MTSGSASSPPPAFGRFRVLHQIGAGVLGPVFRAHDPDGDCLAAVKVFTLDVTPEQAQQLAEELRRLTTVDMSHARLAAPLDAGVTESVAYLALEYVAGESLDSAIRLYGPAPAPDAARLVSHVGEALDAGARAGVFHGALHPGDILVTPGETHVTGLGVATALEHVGIRAPIRRPYVAPEREAGGPWGAAADVFALAAIAHEVLTGRRALPGSEEPLPGLDGLAAHDAAGLREVLEAALDADPSRRPATATELANGIAAAFGLTGGAAAASAGRHAGARRRVRAKPVPKLPGLGEPLAVVHADTPTPGPEPPAPGAAPEPDQLSALHVAIQPVVSPTTAAEEAAVEVALRDPVPIVPGEMASVGGLPSPLPDYVEPSPAAEISSPTPPAIELDLLAPAPAVDGPGLSDLRLSFTPESSDIARPSANSATPGLPGEPTGLDLQRRSEPVPAVDKRFVVNGLRAPGPLVSDPPVPRAFGPARASRGTVPARHAEPYRGSAARSKGVMVPVAFGVGIGLLVGVFVGYWLGARSVVLPGTTSPSAVASQTPASRAPTTPSPLPLVRPGADATSSPAGAPETIRPPATATAAAASQPGGRMPAPTQTVPPAQTTGALTTVAEPARPPVAPPRAAPEARARPVQAGVGRIRVRSTPASADVFLNGKRQGATPRDLPNLPFGRYTVRVTRPGYAAQERSITIGRNRRDLRVVFTLRGRPPSRSTDPAPPPVRPRPPAGNARTRPRAATAAPAVVIAIGSLSIDTRPPGARVRLDGQDVGVSPILLGQVKAGAHTVRLDLPGFTPWTTTVTVKAGERSRVAASMEKVVSR